MNITALEAMVDAHLAAYCEPDAARRLALVREHWSREGHLVDPPFEGRGHAAIADMGATLLSQFPAHRFERTSALDLHHNALRYGWRLLDPQGQPVLAGIDFMDLDVDGRIGRVVGFFGAEPPAKA